MKYKHGSFEHSVNVVEVVQRPEVNGSGQTIRTRKAIVIEGVVRGSDQSSLKTAIAALETAYLGTVVTKSGLLHSDGTTDSAHVIDLSGVTSENGIVATVRWLDGQAEYVTKRSFQATIEASILGAGADQYEYTNRIVRIGDGGPIRVPRVTQDGVLIQQAYPASPFAGFETGNKSSRLGVVVVKPPTFPALLLHDQKHVDEGTAIGPDGVATYFASWTYPYLSAGAF